jgi:GDPmannose 4,6-dehydratase
MRRVLITGCDGQDGVLLTRHLLTGNNQLFGIPNPRSTNLIDKNCQIVRLELDLTNDKDFLTAIRISKPEVIFHLAAINTHSGDQHVFANPEIQKYAHDLQIKVTAKFLDVISTKCTDTTLILAGSSRMYMKRQERNLIDVQTAMDPQDIYGEFKTKARELVLSAQKGGTSAGTAILFNHESIHRKEGFLFSHLGKEIANFVTNKTDAIEVMDMHSRNDWHSATDTVKGLNLMSIYPVTRDFVLASGGAITVKNVIESYFQIYQSGMIPIIRESNPKKESGYLVGDVRETESLLKWKAQESLTSVLHSFVLKNLMN